MKIGAGSNRNDVGRVGGNGRVGLPALNKGNEKCLAAFGKKSPAEEQRIKGK